MLSKGLLEEVRGLEGTGLQQTAGFHAGAGLVREILGFLEGEYDLERAVYLIKEIPDILPNGS